MKHSPQRSLSSVLLAAAFVVSPLKAELIVGLTAQNSLISFDSATPGLVSGAVPITGLVSGDAIFGIDRRPQLGPNNGVLYGFGTNPASPFAGRIYTLNETTGAAMLVSTLAADPADATAPFPFTALNGRTFGVDFNPTVDRLRVVSDLGQNLRINVDNGLTQLDVPLAYQSGDPSVGVTPVVTSVAYSNNFGGAGSTVLRGVDLGTNPDTLVTVTNPNGGLLQTALALPFNASLNGSNDTGYDVSGLTGTPYFAVTTAGGFSSALYAGTTLVGTIGGGVTLRGLAAPVGATSNSVPDGGSMWLLLFSAGLGLGLFRWVSGFRRPGIAAQR